MTEEKMHKLGDAELDEVTGGTDGQTSACASQLRSLGVLPDEEYFSCAVQEREVKKALKKYGVELICNSFEPNVYKINGQTASSFEVYSHILEQVRRTNPDACFIYGNQYYR